MSIWGRGTLKPDEPGFTCDYAGCAIGWLPKLVPNCGLKLEEVSDHLQPEYDGEIGYDAVADYFGLRFREVLFLFSLDDYEDFDLVTPQEVSARILAFLDDPAIVPAVDEDDEEWDSEDDSTEVLSLEQVS